MARRNLSLPDEYDRLLERLAAEEGARQGRTMSASEYVRLLLDREQARQKRRHAASR